MSVSKIVMPTDTNPYAVLDSKGIPLFTGSFDALQNLANELGIAAVIVPLI